MTFTLLMGTLLRPCFLITVADPVGPGLPRADPSVNIRMDLPEVPSWKLLMCSSVLSPSFGSTVGISGRNFWRNDNLLKG